VKLFLVAAAGAALATSSVLADTTGEAIQTAPHAGSFAPPELTADEARAAALSAQWRNTPGIIAPGPDGSVIFLFGQTLPTVVCAPLRACDVELEPGETVMNVHAGDIVRWQFDGARSGPDGTISHVLVKPTVVGVETSLAIMTDRRTYYLNLKSHETEYMARVAFRYPQAAGNVVAQLAATAPKPKVATKAATPKVASKPRVAAPVVNNLDFNYKISGRQSWTSVRVYNDGRKTYIEMPNGFPNGEAPTLLVIGAGRSEQQVNYRIIGNKYVVDTVFSQAVLVAGTGKLATRVKITRTKP
jgi:type IV secretion system protein TrbG